MHVYCINIDDYIYGNIILNLFIIIKILYKYISNNYYTYILPINIDLLTMDMY